MDSGLANAVGERPSEASDAPTVADVAYAPDAVRPKCFSAIRENPAAPVTHVMEVTDVNNVSSAQCVAAVAGMRDVGDVSSAADEPGPATAGRPPARVADSDDPAEFAVSPDQPILPGLPPADIVSVPEAAGREALTRLLGYGHAAVRPGPVALSAHGRVLFFVAPGGSADLPELLDWLDWGGVQLDLAAYPLGDPARLDDPPVRWLHPSAVPLQRPAPAVGPDTPGSGAAAHPTPGLPEPPELIALLATVAAACHRLAVSRGGRATG